MSSCAHEESADGDRLKASEYKSKKDQRRPLNRWNEFVLGPEYQRQAAMLCPQSREYVFESAETFSLTFVGRSDEREATSTY